MPGGQGACCRGPCRERDRVIGGCRRRSGERWTVAGGCQGRIGERWIGAESRRNQTPGPYAKAEARRLARLARKQEAAAARQTRDEAFMRLALEEAQLAAQAGEVPIGAVVVHQPHDRATGKPTAEPRVIARGHNQCELLKDASAHAEFSAMREAEQALDNWRLSDCTIYVTLEPCVMCAGLMQRSRVSRCVYGAPDPKGGALGSLYAIHQDQRLNHRFQVTPGVLEEECQALLRRFFQTRR